jgi:hypothetical protein
MEGLDFNAGRMLAGRLSLIFFRVCKDFAKVML